ncbi:ABC transporter permease subunit [Streptomyces sp. NPDC005318]|uniref:ABC transporter permease n=1 Tax=Streptomyces sp. NPDC005318 TaxID=3157031 RepID=UPI0033A3A47D
MTVTKSQKEARPQRDPRSGRARLLRLLVLTDASKVGLHRRALRQRTWLILAALLVWELLSRTVIDGQLVSRPSAVGVRIIAQFGDATVVSALAHTGRSILLAMTIGSLIGIALGTAVGLSRLMRDAFMTPLLFLLSIPKVIFLPLFVLVFGIGPESVVAFASFEACIYVAVSVGDGMALVQARHLRVARAFRASIPQRLITVVFPSALPGIFTGLWFGIKHAFVGVLTAEIWASTDGIGGLTRTFAENLQTSHVLALIITVSICAILLGSLWNTVESRLTKWR